MELIIDSDDLDDYEYTFRQSISEKIAGIESSKNIFTKLKEKFLKPKNYKKEMSICRQEMGVFLSRGLMKQYEYIKEYYEKEEQAKKIEIKKIRLLIKENTIKKQDTIKEEINLNNQMRDINEALETINSQIEIDKNIIYKFNEFAKKNYMAQWNSIIRRINNADTYEDKLSLLLLLCLISKDYQLLMME